MTSAQPREVPLEYRVKATYLFHFTRFVEWPPDATNAAPLTICVASDNPFGNVLTETIRDEQVNGRAIETRVVREPAACHVLFVPRSVAHRPLLRALQGKPVLTVGESESFLREGGIINFVLENGKVRFDIQRQTAARANLTISSHLLRLARAAVSGLPPHEWRAE